MKVKNYIIYDIQTRLDLALSDFYRFCNKVRHTEDIPMEWMTTKNYYGLIKGKIFFFLSNSDILPNRALEF